MRELAVKFGSAGIMLLGVMVPLSWGQSPPAPMPIHLQVTAEGSLEARVMSCLTEELKAIPGLILSDDTPALTLSVIVVEQKMSDGEMIGYLVYQGGYQPGPQCQGAAAVDPASRPVVVYWQTLRMLPPDLKKACRRMAGDFNTEVIVPTREAQRALIEQMRGR